MSKGRYTRRLRVSSPDGKDVYAIITPSLKTVHIEVRPLDVVIKDSPPFANNGLIRFNVAREKYKESLVSLTGYIETLFLKELDGEVAINEDIYSSIGAKRSDPGRTKKQSNRRTNSADKGKGNTTSVHDSARGNDAPESNRERDETKQAVDVAEVGDTEVDG